MREEFPTTYVCDCCGKKVDMEKQLWAFEDGKIDFMVGCGIFSKSYTVDLTCHSVCDKCIKKLEDFVLNMFGKEICDGQ